MRKNLILLASASVWFLGWWFWPQMNYFAGNYRYNNDNYSDAIDAYSVAIDSNRLEPEIVGKSYFGRAEAKLAIAYTTLGSDEDIYAAVNDYDKAIEIIGNNPIYYRERGTALSYLGAYEEAFKDFRTLGELEGEKPLWSLVRKGGLEKRLGEYNHAIDTLNLAIETWDPTPVMPPNYHLAHTYLRLQQYEDAIKAIDEGEKAQNDYGPAYQLRACAKANMQIYDSALEDYEKGMQLNEIAFRKSSKVFPSRIHDAQIEKEEHEYLKALVNKTATPASERLQKLCTQTWWALYFDKERERSSLVVRNR